MAVYLPMITVEMSSFKLNVLFVLMYDQQEFAGLRTGRLLQSLKNGAGPAPAHFLLN